MANATTSTWNTCHLPDPEVLRAQRLASSPVASTAGKWVSVAMRLIGAAIAAANARDDRTLLIPSEWFTLTYLRRRAGPEDIAFHSHQDTEIHATFDAPVFCRHIADLIHARSPRYHVTLGAEGGVCVKWE